MSRCHVCDATHDGQMSEVPFKRSRQFNIDPVYPHLLICSDCGTFRQNQTPTEEILPGEVPNVESLWDE